MALFNECTQLCASHTASDMADIVRDGDISRLSFRSVYSQGMVAIGSIQTSAKRTRWTKMRSLFGPIRVLTLFWLCVSCFAGDQSLAANNWNVVASPFRPVNITAQGATIWVCGVEELDLKLQGRRGNMGNETSKSRRRSVGGYRFCE